MDLVFTKVYRIIDENDYNSIELVKYNPEKDYYSLLKEQYSLNKRQLILNSSIMIQLLEFFFCKKRFNINSFEFAEKDGEYATYFKRIINNANTNRSDLKIILDNLKTIRSEDSIEIFKMTLEDINQDIYIDFKSNGIITMNKEYYKIANKIIVHFLEDILND